MACTLLQSCCLNLTTECYTGWSPGQFTLASSVAARLAADLRRSDHITDTRASIHWLRAPERVKIKLAVIVYRALHGMAPRYLSELLHRIAVMPLRRRLRSSTSDDLFVPSSRLKSVGNRSFAAAAPRLWHSLPDDITSVPSLSVFRYKLKTFLFRKSYPDIILKSVLLLAFSVLRQRSVEVFYLGHIK